MRDLVSKDKRDKTNQIVKGEQLDRDLIIKEPLLTQEMVERLEELLVGYPNDKFDYIIDGFTNGFRIGFTGDRCPQSCIDLRFARQHPDIVQAKIQKEISEGRIEGPFDEVPLDNFKLSPLGLVEKNIPGGIQADTPLILS